MTMRAWGWRSRSFASKGVSISVSPSSRLCAMRMRAGAAGRSRGRRWMKRCERARGSTRMRPASRLPAGLLVNAGDIPVDGFHALQHALVGIALDAMLAGRFAELAAQAFVAGEPLDRSRERPGILRRHQQRRALVLGDFGNAADRRGDA